MMQSSAAATAAPPAAEPATNEGAEPISIRTRFGEMLVDPNATLRLPRGLFGFSHLRTFALAALPEERYGRFRVLQSLEAPDLSFIVLPYAPSDALVATEDIEEACGTLGVAPGEGVVLLVVSIRKSGEAVEVSVNLRAPIVVDLASRTAWQYVLANPEYSVRHVL